MFDYSCYKTLFPDLKELVWFDVHQKSYYISAKESIVRSWSIGDFDVKLYRCVFVAVFTFQQGSNDQNLQINSKYCLSLAFRI